MQALEMNHMILQQIIQPSDFIIDATLGNGYDALFVSELVGEKGIIWGFDIQDQAIESSVKRLSHFQGSFKTFQASHNQIYQIFTRHSHLPPKAIIYNLGYLPGGNKNITTTKPTVIDSLNQSLEIVQSNGVITIMLYPGHTTGLLEKQALLDWTQQLNQKIVDVFHYHPINQANNPPELLVLYKK